MYGAVGKRTVLERHVCDLVSDRTGIDYLVWRVVKTVVEEKGQYSSRGGSWSRIKLRGKGAWTMMSPAHQPQRACDDDDVAATAALHLGECQDRKRPGPS